MASANAVDVFVLLVVLFIASWYIARHHAEVTYVTSSLDGRTYLVQRLPDRYEAADYLARINKSLTRLVHHVKAKYPDRPEARRLYDNFNPANVSEGSPTSSYTSFSVNKGERIVLCVRQRDDRRSFVDENTVMYVAIHELAHLATASVGHDDDFWDNFRWLLRDAVDDLGIYRMVDYAAKPVPYCNIQIQSNVLLS